MAADITSLLDNALESPWGCTKLTTLCLAISECELPAKPGFPPYYARQAPITPSQAETHRSSRLEDLYRRIGTLTRLEHLDLTMIAVDDDGEVDMKQLRNSTSFPAMLSAGDTSTDRPGFLHHFAGQKRLKRLRGSVSMETEETSVTVEWIEATWMYQNWPLLSHAMFFVKKEDVTEPFQ